METLDGVGARLRDLRHAGDRTLAQLAQETGISVSTLSRLESGGRRPTLELLLPLARAHRVTLDELVGAPPTGDPRVHLQPIRKHGITLLPLSRRAGTLQAYKMILPAPGTSERPEPRTHEGYEWLYVLDGVLRLGLGGTEIEMRPGEAAEFDTHVPHYLQSAVPDRPVELMTLFGVQGERAHLRAAPRPRDGRVDA